MTQVEIIGWGELDISELVISYLLELGHGAPYTLDELNTANEQADLLARSFSRSPEDRPDPSDEP